MKESKNKLVNPHGYGQFELIYTELDHSVNSIILGDGSTRLVTIFSDEENTAGVSFAESPCKQKVGYEFVSNGVSIDPKEQS